MILGDRSVDCVQPGDQGYDLRQRHRHCGGHEQSGGPSVPVCKEAHIKNNNNHNNLFSLCNSELF